MHQKSIALQSVMLWDVGFFQLLSGVWIGAPAQGVILYNGFLHNAKKIRFTSKGQRSQDMKLRDVNPQVHVGYKFFSNSSTFFTQK